MIETILAIVLFEHAASIRGSTVCASMAMANASLVANPTTPPANTNVMTGVMPHRCNWRATSDQATIVAAIPATVHSTGVIIARAWLTCDTEHRKRRVDPASRDHAAQIYSGVKNACSAAAYAATSSAPINSRTECMASWAAPTSTVGIPVRADVMGPIVEPHGRSARCS